MKSQRDRRDFIGPAVRKENQRNGNVATLRFMVGDTSYFADVSFCGIGCWVFNYGWFISEKKKRKAKVIYLSIFSSIIQRRSLFPYQYGSLTFLPSYAEIYQILELYYFNKWGKGVKKEGFSVSFSLFSMTKVICNVQKYDHFMRVLWTKMKKMKIP